MFSNLELPSPKIKPRKVNKKLEEKALNKGLHPALAKIIAARSIPEHLEPDDIVFPKLKKLSNPNKMADINIAAERIANAIINKECIGLETDHDCDGQTSHAILYYNLVKHFNHPEDKIRSYIGHRLKEGYGLSDAVAIRIIQDNPRPNVIITADNGSSDEPRIRKLKEYNIDVIVTDHHQIPKEGIPESAFACLNPTRDDCEFEDKYVAGCMVAWLLMVVVRQKLIEKKYLKSDSPKLIDSLDFVAVGTIADCVSMSKSFNNRIVVSYGLKLIQQGIKPCWRALKPVMNSPVTSEDLGFKLGPLLNSDGRLACAFGSVSLLLAETDEDAKLWVEHLIEQNIERKAIQKQITEKGIIQALNKLKGEETYALSIFLEDGHTGVQGISASRIKDLFGLPTAFLAPKFTDETLVTGSVRGIDDDFHVKEVLQFIADKEPGLFVAFGGHRGAGGLTIKREDVDKFSELFNLAAKEQLEGKNLGPVVFSDGEIGKQQINLDFINLISNLQPFGREFEPPIFHSKGILSNFYPIGDGTHTKLSVKIEGKYFKAVWFNKNLNDIFSIGDEILVAFSLLTNCYKGLVSCELQIVAMEKLR